MADRGDWAAACEHQRGDSGRALAARASGLAPQLPRGAVPELAAAPRVHGVGSGRRCRRHSTRRRPRGLHRRPRHMGLAGGGGRGEPVPSSPRGGSAHLGGRRSGRRVIRAADRPLLTSCGGTTSSATRHSARCLGLVRASGLQGARLEPSADGAPACTDHQLVGTPSVLMASVFVAHTVGRATARPLADDYQMPRMTSALLSKLARG